jgi:hypothetical protein
VGGDVATLAQEADQNVAGIDDGISKLRCLGTGVCHGFLEPIRVVLAVHVTTPLDSSRRTLD